MFYLPSPVVGPWCLGAGWTCRQGGGARLRFLSDLLMVCSLVPLGFVVVIENQWTRPPATATAVQNRGAESEPAAVRTAASRPLRLIHWNICRSRSLWPRQRSLLRSCEPDVIVLSEITDVVRDADFPGYQVLRRKNMLVAARGPMSATGSLVPHGVLHAFLVQCELPGQRLHLLIGDMASPPRLPRHPYLTPMMRIAEERGADIIVGDMNAPRRSLAFSEMSGGFRHAYEAAGSGWSYTWPVPVPVLAIDQCICGARLTALNYDLRSTTLSDHRLQVLDFLVKN